MQHQPKPWRLIPDVLEIRRTVGRKTQQAMGRAVKEVHVRTSSFCAGKLNQQGIWAYGDAAVTALC
jgi:hypothetical protein